MSHIVKVKVNMTNKPMLMESIRQLGLECLGEGRHKLFSGQQADGIAFKLPGWQYPVVINPTNGEASYDNFNGSWGAQIELDKVVQRYTLEVAKEQAMLSGFTTSEELLDNGDVKLRMEALQTS